MAQVYEGNRVFNVVVILDEAHRKNPEAVGALLLRTPDGTPVRVSELADIEPSSARYMVLHDGARRRQTVTCNVENRDVASFVHEAEARVKSNVSLPSGTYAVFGGEAEARESATTELLLHSAVAASA